jgi:Tfp pilus assembly protein FimT
MKTRIAAIALAWIVSATPSFAANWKVWEGTSGSTQGQWSLQIQNSAITGQSQMTTIVGSQLDYKLTGSVQAGAYQIARTHSSDGQLCNYRGDLSSDGGKIVGVAICGSVSAPWVAVPAPNTD